MCCCFLFYSIGVFGQGEFRTKSGSLLNYKSDGSWSYISEEEAEINPFEIPGKTPVSRNENEIKLFEQLVRQYKMMEAEYAVKSLLKKNEISRQEIQVSYYKSLKNDLSADLAKKKLKEIKTDKKEYEKLYENYADTLEMVAKWQQDKEAFKDDKFLILLKSNNLKFNSLNNNYGDLAIRRNTWKHFELDNRDNFAVENQCFLIFNGDNPNGKGKLIRHEQEPFFTYTPAKIKPFYKEEDYLVVSASLEKIDGKYYLILNLRFRSKDVGKSYGYVRRGEHLFLYFVDQRKTLISSVIDSDPQLEPITGNTKYELVYEIDKESKNLLKEEYLDKIGIMYSSGYEEYLLYDVDLIMNQLNCVENAD